MVLKQAILGSLDGSRIKKPMSRPRYRPPDPSDPATIATRLRMLGTPEHVIAKHVASLDKARHYRHRFDGMAAWEVQAAKRRELFAHGLCGELISERLGRLNRDSIRLALIRKPHILT